MNTEKRYYNIEFLRFAFAICIVYFHLLHSFMMDYTGNADLYIWLAEQSKYAKYIVECFFIISGYFLYHTIQRHPEMTTQGAILWGRNNEKSKDFKTDILTIRLKKADSGAPPLRELPAQW